MKKRITKWLAVTCVFALLVGTFAYFTDRVEVDANVTSGTVGITETQTWQDNLLNADGDRILNNLNPGDSRSLAFTVTNNGNKAIDVRHTIKLSVVDANNKAKAMSMGQDVSGESMLQFDVFKKSDVLKTSEENGNMGYDLKPGATPVFSTSTYVAATQMGAKRTIDETNGTVTYYFADTVLDGVGDANKAEVGYKMAEQVASELTETDVVLNAAGTAVSYDYVLIFRDTTLNDFQGCTVYAEMVVEAKQHLNTKSSWENIETITYEMKISGDAKQNTTINTAPNNHIGVLETVTDDTAGTYNNHSAH